MAKTDYTREELIAICERSFIPQAKWNDRDSCAAQLGVGAAFALLKAGCKYDVLTAENQPDDKDPLATDDHTIWLRFWVHNFRWFEYGDDDQPDGFLHEDHIYLPTPARLDERNGNDWY